LPNDAFDYNGLAKNILFTSLHFLIYLDRQHKLNEPFITIRSDGIKIAFDFLEKNFSLKETADIIL